MMATLFHSYWCCMASAAFVVLLLGHCLAVNYTIDNEQTETIRIESSRVDIESIDFGEKATLVLELAEGVQTATVVIDRIGISGGASISPQAHVEVVFREIYSRDDSEWLFTFKGPALYRTDRDLLMDMPNPIVFDDQAVFDFGKFENTSENIGVFLGIAAAELFNSWRMSSVELHGKPLQVKISNEFIKVENREIVADLVWSQKPMRTVTCSSFTLSDFTLAFDGKGWSYKFKSAFQKVMLTGGSAAVTIIEQPFVTIHCVEGEEATCELPLDLVTEGNNWNWTTELGPDVEKLTVLIAGNGIRIDLNTFVGTLVELRVIGVEELQSPLVRFIYDPEVTESKISAIYLENIELTIEAPVENIAPFFDEIVLDRQLSFATQPFLSTNWTRVGSIKYDISVIKVADVWRLPNAEVVGSSSISRVDTDLLTYKFYFKDDQQTVAEFPPSTLADVMFPYRHVPLLNIESGKNVSTIGPKAVLSPQKMVVGASVTQSVLYPLIIANTDLIIDTVTENLPFAFVNISSMDIITEKTNINIIGNFSVASDCDFKMSFTSPATTLDFSEDLIIGANSNASFHSVLTWGPVHVGRKSSVSFRASSVTTEIRFESKVREQAPLIRVHPNNDFAPQAIYFEMQLPEESLELNTTSPLICGYFDCDYVQSRGRYSIVDDKEGFYMFQGSCQELTDVQECYMLTYSFTTFTDDHLDGVTVALIVVIVTLVLTVIIVAVVLIMRIRQ